MFKTVLITGGTQLSRQQEIEKLLNQQKLSLNIVHPDLFLIKEEKSIKIEQIRKLKINLNRKPYQAQKIAAVIFNADRMSLAAQNAFLKTLEDTPSHALIILETQMAESLLSTVVSRCQQVKLANDSDSLGNPASEYRSYFNDLPKLPIYQRLEMISRLNLSKEQALDMVTQALAAGRSQLKSQPQLLLVRRLKAWQKTHHLLQANVNPNLALGNLFLILS